MSGKNFGASHLANEGHDNVDIRRLRFRDRAWPHSALCVPAFAALVVQLVVNGQGRHCDDVDPLFATQVEREVSNWSRAKGRVNV